MLADAVVDIEEAGDALLLAELADYLLVRGDLFRVRGSLKVKGEGELVGVPYLRVLAHLLLKLENDVRAAEVAAGRPVDVAPDAVSDLYRMAGCPFHDLDDRCLAHF
ncbi:hypothetical protein SDC9_167956 [bioreactor metagenome]|uniref:Uncharacterized protein n=1 Tax=bioreactor metagenome TaxID=1076179 RepID=A0A645G159_9ZZZZ